jgi:hypothetical protein
MLCSGVGKIFVLFMDKDGCANARSAVNGRTFNGQTVEAVFYPESLLLQKVRPSHALHMTSPHPLTH